MIEEIPRSFLYICDHCQAEHVQHNAGSHYSNSTPPKWSALRFKRDGENAVEKLLCFACTQKVIIFLAEQLPDTSHEKT